MTRNRKPRRVVIVAYPGCSLLELAGAQYVWSVASMMSSLEVTVAGPTTSFIETSTPVRLTPQTTFADAPDADVLIVVGGGEAALTASNDPAIIDYLRRAADHALRRLW